MAQAPKPTLVIAIPVSPSSTVAISVIESSSFARWGHPERLRIPVAPGALERREAGCQRSRAMFGIPPLDGSGSDRPETGFRSILVGCSFGAVERRSMPERPGAWMSDDVYEL